MVSSFDPDVFDDAVFDDRTPRVVKEKDPARQRMGKNNRKRGHKAEREWHGHIAKAANRAGLTVMQMPELRGSVAKEDVRWIDTSFEVKSIRQKDANERWLTPGALTKAWAAARRHCEHRTPIVVVCARRQGVVTRWRVYAVEGCEPVDGHDWIADRVLALRTGA